MKFLILLAIVILSCCCSMSSAGPDIGINDVANTFTKPFLKECSTFESCYAGCTWLNLCALFKEKCRVDCAIECGCHHSAANANFKLTGVHYIFGALSVLLALRTSL